MPHAIHRPGLPRCETLLGAVGAVALHALGAWVVLQQPATRQPPAPVAVLEASLLSVSPAPAVAPETPASPPIPDAPPPPAQPPAAMQPVAATQQPAQARPAPVKTDVSEPVRPRPRPATAEPSTEPSIAEPSTVAPVAASAAALATPAQPRSTPQDVPANPPVTAPRFDAAYLNNPAPTYPPLSRRLGEQGRVLVRVFVNPNGAPAKVQLRESSGHRRLDAAAEAAVRRWRFVPARRGQAPVGDWVLVPIAFKLRN